MCSFSWLCIVLSCVIPQVYLATGTCPCSVTGPPDRFFHPQVRFNEADWVAKVTVIGKFVSRWSQPSPAGTYRDWIYTVTVKKVFKGTGLHKGCKKAIHTMGKVSPCGVHHLKKNQTYLLSGEHLDEKFWIDQCGLHTLWSEVTPHQKNSLNGRYAENEECQATCALDTTLPLDCYYKYGTCVARKRPRPDSTCRWKYGYNFFFCIAGVIHVPV